ncbi:TIGR03899 family protein [Pseudomonas sp. L5B5]|uniref:TIGR03899 family protein n=1 Tax=Pseudomonas sp. L5B5 TaxID=2883205 RepID=UPI001CFC2EDA|nr:TIGR03899 family protein [Pseudomonas sp. L5B5]UCZ82935.1 TIGR03899 family protein [Pseudomonas sp. L5B5]
MEEEAPVSDKVLNKLIETISNGCGHLYRPIGLRRDADAQAYSVLKLGQARTEAEIQREEALLAADHQRRSVMLQHDEDLARRSAKRRLHQELLKQENLERIFAKALENPPESAVEESVDQDWLTDFVERAEKISSQQMQALWARILSLEVGNPGSFSVRAMDVLKSMTGAEANAFRKLCAIAARLGRNSAPVVIVNGRRKLRWFNALADIDLKDLELHRCGIPLTDQLALEALGLIHAKELCISDLPAATVLDFDFYSKSLRVEMLKDKSTLAFINFTGVGAELYQLLDEEVNPDYVELLQDKLQKIAKVELIDRP